MSIFRTRTIALPALLAAGCRAGAPPADLPAGAPPRPVLESGSGRADASSPRRAGRAPDRAAVDGAAPTIWSDAVKVSDRPTGSGFQNEPSIAVDATGQVTIAWQAKLASGLLEPMIAASRDGGRTFSPSMPLQPTRPPGVAEAGDVTLATDPAGRAIHLAWAQYGDCRQGHCFGAPGAIAFTEAPAGTLAFAPVRAVDETPFRGYVDRPWLSVSPRGDVYVTYDDFGRGRRPIRRRSANSIEFVSRGGSRIELDDGSLLNQGNGPPAFDAAGGVQLVVQYRHRRRSDLFLQRWDAAGRFSDQRLGVPLYSAMDHAVNARPQTTSTFPDGATCVVYLNADAETVSVESRRIEGGRVLPPVRVNDARPGSRNYVWMAQDEDRNVHLVWLDGRDGDGWRPYSAHSRDGCRTWTRNYPVVPSAFHDDGTQENFIGDDIAIAARAGRIHVAWTDTRTGRPEIFAASAANPFGKR